MADSQTPNYNLVKPEISGSADTWGAKLNQNADKIDEALHTLKTTADGTVNGGSFSAEVEVAASAITDVFNTASPFVRVTGTALITSLGSGVGTQNKLRYVRFIVAGATIKHNATIINLSGADIVVEAGDIATFESDNTSPTPVVRMIAYARATGEPVKFADRGKLLTLPELVYTSDVTLTTAEAGKALVANRATPITFNMPALSAAGTIPYIIKNMGAGLLTIDPNSAELIEGAATLAVEKGATLLVWPSTLPAIGWRAFMVHAKATVEEFRQGVADRWLDPATVHDAMKWVTLDYSSAVTPDHKAGCYRKMTISANLTMNAPVNPIENYPLEFWFVQTGATGDVTWNSAYDFGDFGGPPDLSGVVGQADVVSFTCLSVSPLRYQFRGIRRRVD